MKITAGVQFQSPEFATAGVQDRMNAVVAHFTNQPRGFCAAWCAALPPAVVGKEPWDADYKTILFDLPKGFSELARADVALIGQELNRSSSIALVHELEVACVVAGHSLPADLRSVTRREQGADAKTYYGELDVAARDWQRAVGTSDYVTSHVLDAMSRQHHARFLSGTPFAHDAKGVAAAAGVRAAMETRTARAAAEQLARRLPPNDTAGIVAAFTSGTRRTVQGLTEAHLTDIMAHVASRIDSGNAGECSRFLQHFREGTHHGGVEFADKALGLRFARDEFAGPLREACERLGLDFLDYNGIFDMDRFSAKMDAFSAKRAVATT